MQTSPSPYASALKTAVFVLTAVLANSFGNLLLAIGMESMPSFTRTALSHYVLLLITSHFVLPGALLTAVYVMAQLSLFSWADLSFVVPLIASSYIVTTLLSEFILGEHVERSRWLGVLFISVGVIFVSKTKPSTAVKSTRGGPC